MATKPWLAVDMDQVFCGFDAAFAVFNNRHFGSTVAENDFLGRRYAVALGISRLELSQRFKFFGERAYIGTQPIEGSQRVLHALSERYALAIVTGRDSYFDFATQCWLDQHFSGLFETIAYVEWRPKAVICQQLGAVALIDDSPGHLAGCMERGIQPILFGEQPQDQEGITHNMVICADWAEVEAYFDGSN